MVVSLFIAEINDKNICFALTEIEDIYASSLADNCIPIETFDLSLLGKKWTGEGWEEVEQPEIEPEPTQLDRIEANTKNLLSSNSALDVLLGVSDVGQNASG